MLVGVVLVVVVAVVVVALTIIGPPSEQRGLRFDERRVADLRGIARAVDLYWTRSGRLPTDAEEISDKLGNRVLRTDPETFEPYAYRALESQTYELCADFNFSSTGFRTAVQQEFWSHASGRQCFELEAEEVNRLR